MTVTIWPHIDSKEEIAKYGIPPFNHTTYFYLGAILNQTSNCMETVNSPIFNKIKIIEEILGTPNVNPTSTQIAADGFFTVDPSNLLYCGHFVALFMDIYTGDFSNLALVPAITLVNMDSAPL